MEVIEMSYVPIPSSPIELPELPPFCGGAEIDYDHVAKCIAIENIESSFKYMREQF